MSTTRLAPCQRLASQQRAWGPATGVQGHSNHGRYTVCTTFPTTADLFDSTVVNEIQRHIQYVGSGDSIKVAMYLWETKEDRDQNPEDVATDLINADRRGVDVKIVIGKLDDRGDGPRNAETISRLRTAGIPVTVCQDSCVEDDPDSRYGAMHNKFFLIENGGSKNVLQTSTNLSAGQLAKHQNLLITRGDVPLFNYYTAYWNRLNAKSWNGWSDADRESTGEYDYSKAYLFPRDARDPVVDRLSKVTKCDTS